MAGIFPQPGRHPVPVGVVLAEQHDERAQGRRYLTFTNDLDTDASPAANILSAPA